MKITTTHIKAISPLANPRLATLLPDALNYWLPRYGITNKAVVALFLGEAAEETDGFKTLQEYASGAAYEGRKDLGNTQAGDGVRFKGRGIFMDTGRVNYAVTGKELNLDLVSHPELLLDVGDAVEAACAYWNDHKLTPLALAGDIVSVTQKINGGQNGEAVRVRYWQRAKLVITSDLDPYTPPKVLPTAAPAVAPPTAPKAPIGVTPMLNGSKTLMASSTGIASVLFTAAGSFLTAGNAQMMIAIFGSAIAGVLFFLAQMFQRSAIGKVGLGLIDQVAVAMESNNDAIIAQLAQMVDASIKKAQAAAPAALLAAPPAALPAMQPAAPLAPPA